VTGWGYAIVGQFDASTGGARSSDDSIIGDADQLIHQRWRRLAAQQIGMNRRTRGVDEHELRALELIWTDAAENVAGEGGGPGRQHPASVPRAIRLARSPADYAAKADRHRRGSP